MKTLITGITGFAGSHLAEYLLTRGDSVYGTYRVRSQMDHLQEILPYINLIECELKDSYSVDHLIKTVRPDYIFHLAAQSFVPTSWNSPQDTLTNNIISQVNIFEAVRSYNLSCRIQIACSSEEYGMVYPHETPIAETNPFRPLSPYGVSKVAQDLLGYQYYQSYGLDVVRTRTFNHEGPRRGVGFVLSNFAHQIALIEEGKKNPVIEVGNLESIRDFTDVRDVVKAYVLALEHCPAGEAYNIGSGTPWKIRDALDILISLSKKKVTVSQDPSRLRPSDVLTLHCDAEKFMRITGWKPSIPFAKTLEDLLDYWRLRV